MDVGDHGGDLSSAQDHEFESFQRHVAEHFAALPASSDLLSLPWIRNLWTRSSSLRTSSTRFCPSPSRIILFQSTHEGESFHCLVLKLGFFLHMAVSNSLIHMFACCDGLDLARQLFNEMPERDRVCYNSVMWVEIFDSV